MRAGHCWHFTGRDGDAKEEQGCCWCGRVRNYRRQERRLPGHGPRLPEGEGELVDVTEEEQGYYGEVCDRRVT